MRLINLIIIKFIDLNIQFYKLIFVYIIQILINLIHLQLKYFRDFIFLIEIVSEYSQLYC